MTQALERESVISKNPFELDLQVISSNLNNKANGVGLSNSLMGNMINDRKVSTLTTVGNFKRCVFDNYHHLSNKVFDFCAINSDVISFNSGN